LGKFVNVSLDYDDTYSLDPKTWDKIINILLKANHNVYCVTKRYEHLADDIKEALDIPIIFVPKGKSKGLEVFNRGIKIDVWIDDKPLSIIGRQITQSKSVFRANRF
jgi:hypothetical protein